MKALLMMLVATVAQSPQQFDLNCAGIAGADAKTGLTWEGVDLHMRVDLARSKWCAGDCSVLHDIAEVQPASLWLEKQSDFEKQRQIVHFRTIDRRTGEYLRIEESRFGTIKQRAQCTPGPFSGFPKIETKF